MNHSGYPVQSSLSHVHTSGLGLAWTWPRPGLDLAQAWPGPSVTRSHLRGQGLAAQINGLVCACKYQRLSKTVLKMADAKVFLRFYFFLLKRRKIMLRPRRSSWHIRKINSLREMVERHWKSTVNSSLTIIKLYGCQGRVELF